MKRTQSEHYLETELPPRVVQALGEMDGFSELGMEKDLLTTARALIKFRPVYAAVVDYVLWAVLAHADRLGPWRRRIENAYSELPTRAQRLLPVKELWMFGIGKRTE